MRAGDRSAAARLFARGAFGEAAHDARDDSLHPFAYAGGMYDAATQLYRFGTRDHDPRIGRWTAKDPTRREDTHWRLYAHVGGDAANRVDPSALDPRNTSPGVWVCREPMFGSTRGSLLKMYHWFSVAGGFGFGCSAWSQPQLEDEDPRREGTDSAECYCVSDADPECVYRQVTTGSFERCVWPANDCEDAIGTVMGKCGAQEHEASDLAYPY